MSSLTAEDLLDVCVIHQRFHRSLDEIERSVLASVTTPTLELKSALATGRRKLAWLLRDERCIMRDWTLRSDAGVVIEELPGPFRRNHPSMTRPRAAKTMLPAAAAPAAAPPPREARSKQLWEIRVLLQVRRAKQISLASSPQQPTLRKDIALIDREVARLRLMRMAPPVVVVVVATPAARSPPPSPPLTATPAPLRSIRWAESALATPAGVSTRSLASPAPQAQPPRISPGGENKVAAKPTRRSRPSRSLSDVREQQSIIAALPSFGTLSKIMRGPVAMVPSAKAAASGRPSSSSKSLATAAAPKVTTLPPLRRRPTPMPFSYANFVTPGRKQRGGGRRTKTPLGRRPASHSNADQEQRQRQVQQLKRSAFKTPLGLSPIGAGGDGSAQQRGATASPSFLFTPARPSQRVRGASLAAELLSAAEAGAARTRRATAMR